MPRIKEKKKKGAPTINTASLPDVIFILLFFFMVATVMRETEMKVQVTVPEATELTKLEKKSLVSYIYIGEPMEHLQDKYGTAPRLQLNDAIAAPKDIAQFVENERSKITPQKLVPHQTISLKVDEDAKMGIVTDVKQKLRQVNALKVNYSSRPRQEVY
jgi:biopolymer transport protein ExbD